MSSELTSFMPRLALRHAGSGQALPNQTRVMGCLLFADISGFTSLAVRLSEEQAHGAERLQEILSSIFGPLVDCADANGGDVISFPGDAAIVVWTDEEGLSLSELTALAARTAIEVQEIVGRLDKVDDYQLHLRIALDVGEMSSAIVGGHDESWHFVLQSDCFDNVQRLLKNAEPGETLCSSEFKNLASDLVSAIAKHDSYLVTAITGAAAQAKPPDYSMFTKNARSFVPHAFRDLIHSGQLDWTIEFRNITTVFVKLDLCSSESDPLSHLQQVVLTLQQRATRFNGLINQLVHDDKGLVLVVAFGIRDFAHEDDVLRAVYLAQDLCNSLNIHAVRCRIGISTGKVFVGRRGNQKRAELALIGHSVNLAARLMTEADDVLCDGATKRYSKNRFFFENLPPQRLKGVAREVAVFRPCGERKSSFAQEDIIGRNSECAIIESSIRDFEQENKPGLILIRGNPGIGKSELMNYALRQAQATSIRVLKGATDSISSGTPYFALRTIVFALMRLPDTASIEAITAKLQELFPEDSSFRGALLAPVLHVSLTRVARVTEMNPLGRAEAVCETLIGLVNGLSESSPVMVMVEDAHWLDGASSQFFEKLIASDANVLLLFSKRPSKEETVSFLAQNATHVLELSELDRQDTTTLLCRALEVDTVQQELVDYIFERTGGQPLFTEQLARSLRTQPGITFENGECRLVNPDGLESLDLPYDLTAVITSTLESLSLEDQIVLKVASVFGAEFEPDLLASVLQPNELKSGLDQCLANVEHAGLVYLDRSSYRFKHALIQRAIYDSMPRSQRKELHSVVGNLYESQGADNRSKMSALLAHHFELAGDESKTMIYLEIAGQNALSRDYANHDAIKFFTRLLNLNLDSTNLKKDRVVKVPGGKRTHEVSIRRAMWMRAFGEAYLRIGSATHAADAFKQSLQLLGQPFPLSRMQVYRTIALGLAKRIIISPKYPKQNRFNEQEKLAVENTVASYERFARITYTEGDSTLGVACSLKALPLAESLGPSFEYCNEYSMMANVVAITGRMKMAHKYAELARHVAEDIDNKAAIAHANHRALLFRMQFADQSVQANFAYAAKLFDELGNVYEAAVSYCAKGRLCFIAGDYTTAEEMFYLGMDRAKRGSAIGPNIWTFTNLCEICYRVGRFDEAQRFCQEAADILESSSREDQGSIFHNEGVLALLALRSNQHEIALKHAQRALNAHDKGGWLSFSAGAGYMGILEVLLFSLRADALQVPEAEKTVRRLIKKIRRHRSRRVVIPFSFYYGAIWCRQQGRSRLALKELRRGLTLTQEMNMPFEQALLLTELGSLSTSSDENYGPLEAREVFEKIGAAQEHLDVKDSIQQH